MKLFWFLYSLVIGALALYASGAFAEPMYGLFCLSENETERVAIAYQHGGYDEEDALASQFVKSTRCIRILYPIDVEIVYEGKVFGEKIVVGVSRNPHGKPELFGLMPFPLQKGST